MLAPFRVLRQEGNPCGVWVAMADTPGRQRQHRDFGSRL